MTVELAQAAGPFQSSLYMAGFTTTPSDLKVHKKVHKKSCLNTQDFIWTLYVNQSNLHASVY